MSYLIIGKSKDALRMSKASSLDKWPHVVIDPLDMVPQAKLYAMLTGDDYSTVIDSFTKVTPEQPDVEPWDLENLINPVYLIQEKYVRALAEMKEDKLLALAKKWCAIEELKWYKFDPKDIKENLVEYRRFAAKCLNSKLSMLMLIAN